MLNSSAPYETDEKVHLRRTRKGQAAFLITKVPRTAFFHLRILARRTFVGDIPFFSEYLKLQRVCPLTLLRHHCKYLMRLASGAFSTSLQVIDWIH